jgi:hypothetical protein
LLIDLSDKQKYFGNLLLICELCQGDFISAKLIIDNIYELLFHNDIQDLHIEISCFLLKLSLTMMEKNEYSEIFDYFWERLFELKNKSGLRIKFMIMDLLDLVRD